MDQPDQSQFLHFAKLFRLPVSEPQRTLRDDEVAAVFREPGVKTGYRPPGRSWGYYLASLFHVNNETVNVWTHLVGCVLMTYHLYSYAVLHGVWADDARRVVHMFNLCGVIYTCCSACAHTFHSKSPITHFLVFQVDYAGIGLYTFGFGLVAFYVCCESLTVYSALYTIFLPMNVFFAWFSFSCGSFAKLHFGRSHPVRRKILQLGSILLHILISCCGAIQRYEMYFEDNKARELTMTHHTTHVVVLVAAGFFFVSHFPEKLLPGKFDFVGQGHQIFHVLVLFGSYLQMRAAEIDLKNLNVEEKRPIPTWSFLLTSLVAVILLDLITIYKLRQYVKTNIAKDDK